MIISYCTPHLNLQVSHLQQSSAAAASVLTSVQAQPSDAEMDIGDVEAEYWDDMSGEVLRPELVREAYKVKTQEFDKHQV